MADRCAATTKSGTRCHATVVADGMCAWHAPSWAERRRQWSVRGGRGKSNRARATKVMATYGIADVRCVLSTTLRDLLNGKVDVGVANAAASLGRAIVLANERGVLEERLTELERRAGTASGGRDVP